MFKMTSIMLLAAVIAAPVMAESGDMKSGSSMDHSGMDHSNMVMPKVEKDTPQQEMKGHEGMSMDMQPKAANDAEDMPALKSMPASGKAREAGFDGSYNMKQTTVESSIETQCLLASRGIIILDRVSWKKCAAQSSESNK